MRDVVEGGETRDIPPRMREDTPRVREALESSRFVKLPGKFDIYK